MKRILLTVACAMTLLSHAQFQFQGANLGETTSPIQSIGIGDFGGVGDFQARLHVNNFFCNTPASGTFNGFLFRTDGDDDVDNRWQLFTGTSATSQTERFRIRTFSGGFDTWLERTQSGSEADIRLLTAEVQLRARNKRLGDFCELAGPLADEVIMGDGSDVNFSALALQNKRSFSDDTIDKLCL
jgi:hypothetical protein